MLLPPPLGVATEMEGTLKAPTPEEGRKFSAWLTGASNLGGVEGEAIEAGLPKLSR